MINKYNEKIEFLILYGLLLCNFNNLCYQISVLVICLSNFKKMCSYFFDELCSVTLTVNTYDEKILNEK